MKSLQCLFILCLFFCNWKRLSSSDTEPPEKFSDNDVKLAFQEAQKDTASQRRVFTKAQPEDSSNSEPEIQHNIFQKSTPRSLQQGRTQEVFEKSTIHLKNRYNLTSKQVRSVSAATSLEAIEDDEIVQECKGSFEVNCDSTLKYRTYDGSCNNLKHPSWGMASTCFERLLDPHYNDGISELRRAISGKELPLPRKVSIIIHTHRNKPSVDVSHLHMQWGQFLTHDIALAPLQQLPNGQPLTCCPLNSSNHPQCGPIIISPDDPFYSRFGIDCLNNARTVICATCTLGSRQQVNQVTSYIDGSQIYDTNSTRSRALRNNDNTGTMRSNNTYPKAGELLPSSDPKSDGCSFQVANLTCFAAGDTRVNQHPALTSFHTIFVRQHNRIAKQLKRINSRWNEEKLFQETRKIIGAQLQMITYNEYLPLVIGEERMEKFDLYVEKSDARSIYDPTLTPMMFNEVSAVAFRFGHSQINDFFREIPSQKEDRGHHLKDLFAWPFELYTGQLERIVRGMYQSPAQKFDRYMVPSVTNHVYQRRSRETGLDLAALDIFRGRDHGIPPYVEMVRFCGGPNITSFRQLDSRFQDGYRKVFEKVYENVKDIDFFSGGLAEKPVSGAVVGPTFACVIAIQFYHLKYGDRFYFEHGRQPGSFTKKQLRELKKTSFAEIICKNSNSRIKEIQKNVLLKPSRWNPKIQCKDLPTLDLSCWTE